MVWGIHFFFDLFLFDIVFGYIYYGIYVYLFEFGFRKVFRMNFFLQDKK